MLFIDLDGFKEVNDALGHESGDGVLRDVARRIAAEVPTGVSVGRLGGDEFLAIMIGADEAAAIDGRATDHRRHRTARHEAHAVPAQREHRDRGGSRAESAEQLLHRADQAMYRAKGEGAGRFNYAGLADASSGGDDVRLAPGAIRRR